jgi:hypothetical protein
MFQRLTTPRWEYWGLLLRRERVIDLRLSGYPGSQSAGVLSLIFSPAPEGQEMRMLCLCVTLLAFAVIGAVTL